MSFVLRCDVDDADGDARLLSAEVSHASEFASERRLGPTVAPTENSVNFNEEKASGPSEVR